MTRRGWRIGHAVAVAAATVLCGVAFIYTGDSDLFVVLSTASALGLMALVSLQIRNRLGGRR